MANLKKKDKQPWIVAGRTDGFGARMCALLNAMALSKMLDVAFKFSWVAPENAPFMKENNKNLENNQVLIPYANLPLKEELFSPNFLEQYCVDDGYVGNIEQIPSYFKPDTLERYKQEPFPLEFGWYSDGIMLEYADMDSDKYRQILADCWTEIGFAKNIQEVIKLAKKSVKAIKGDFVAIHIRSGDIVYSDSWAPVVFQKTAFSVYLAVHIARLEIQKGNHIVLFSDDLSASATIKNILTADSEKNNIQIHCIDDFFARNDYLGYEQSIFEIVFMAQAKKICNGGSSGFSGLAMRIGNIREHSSPDDYFSVQEQAEIIESSIHLYDFHPAHKAFAYMKLFLLGLELGRDLEYLKLCAQGAYQHYATNFYALLYLGVLLKSGDYIRANALAENVYHRDNAGFFVKFLEGKSYGNLFGDIPTLCCRVFDVENYPYLVYFALKMGVYVMQLSEQQMAMIPNYTLYWLYVNDYTRIANFLLKTYEMSAGGGALFADICPYLKRIEISIVGNAIQSYSTKISLLEYQMSINGKSYSQYGQDLFVKNYFLRRPKKAQYYFVDIGANDGIKLSNTYMLEHSLDQNWSGLLIEADSAVFARLLQNRNSNKNTKYNVALCNTDGIVEFMQIDGPQMLSGIVSEYDPRHVERIKAEIARSGGSYKIVKMQGAKFTTILKNHPTIHTIDYLSIDVEGGEMKILESIDFSSIKVTLLGIEDNYPDNSGIGEYLMQVGFREIARMGCDRFFERDI